MRRMTVFACLLAACAFPGLLRSACATDKEMLVLTQTHREYGRVTAYLSEDAMKLVNNERGFAFFAGAPDWDVRLYNEKRNVCHTFPAKSWRVNGIRTAMNFDENDIYVKMTPVLRTIADYAGVKAQVFVYLGKRDNGKTFNNGEYWICPASPASAEARRALCAIYETKLLSGAPLRFRRFHTTGFTLSTVQGELAKPYLVEYLWTAKVETAPFDPKILSLPSGLKEVSDGDVLLSKEERENSIDILIGK